MHCMYCAGIQRAGYDISGKVACEPTIDCWLLVVFCLWGGFGEIPRVELVY